MIISHCHEILLRLLAKQMSLAKCNSAVSFSSTVMFAKKVTQKGKSLASIFNLAFFLILCRDYDRRFRDVRSSLSNTHSLYAITINVSTVGRMTALIGHWQGQATSVRT